jgi:hypothetical protein
VNLRLRTTTSLSLSALGYALFSRFKRRHRIDTQHPCVVFHLVSKTG